MRTRQKRGHQGRTMTLVLLLTLALAPTTTMAALSANDQDCLGCHSMTGLNKTLGDGSKLSLHVAEEGYAESVHNAMGCKSCHFDVDSASHPAMSGIASRHEYSVAKSAVCRNCHGEVFEAYAGSMHGQARLGDGHVDAPICADCHQVHDVQAVAASDRIRTACLGCHKQAPLAHDQWLPNSSLHLDVVSCPACHSPTAERAVDLRLFDNEKQVLLSEDPDNPGFEETARTLDVAGDGLDPMELRQLVRESSGESTTADVKLHGRLEVRGGADAHRLTVKLEAVRDCETCHQNGALPYENVTISIAGEDGRRVRYATSDEALTSAITVDTIGGFYTAGGTRIEALDWLVVLAVIAGLAVPVTHMSIRKHFKNKR